MQANNPAAPAQPARRLELQDPLNRYLYHPLAGRLALALKPLGVSPNAVSVAGALLVVVAAWAYTSLSWPVSAALGFSLHALWHVVDGADGDLARLTGKSSPTGELVDGVCDYSGHVVLYIALAAMLDDTIGGWSWLLASLAGASHIVQNNHSEVQRRTYLWRAYGVPWLKNAEASGDAVFQKASWFSRTFGWMAKVYIRLAQNMTPAAAKVDAAFSGPSGSGRDGARALVVEMSGPSLTLQKLLGSNPRTIVLGFSMALGGPLFFFLAEIVPMNLLLAWSVRHHNRLDLRLAERIG